MSSNLDLAKKLLFTYLNLNPTDILIHVCNRVHFGYIDEEGATDSDEEKRESHLHTRLQHLISGPNKSYRDELPKSNLLPFDNQSFRMGFDKIYVINLARRTDRRVRVESALKDLRLDYEIFDAIDAKKINDSYVQSLGIALIPNYADPYHKRPLNFGEIGCFLSHYFIWRDVCISAKLLLQSCIFSY